MRHSDNDGFTLVEVLLALALVGIVVGGLATALLYTDRLGARVYEGQQGRLSAQECVAVMRWYRDAHGFAALNAGTYGLDHATGGWTLAADPDTDGAFTRSVIVTDEDAFTKRLVCTVAWDEDGVAASSSLTSLLSK